MELSRESIVQAALELVHEEGFQRLNMRAIGKRLDAHPSSIYWHVANRDELLGLMAAHLYLQALEAVERDADWKIWLRNFAISFRAVIRKSHDASKIWAFARPIFKDHDREVQALMGELTERGVPQEHALSFELSMIAHVIGWGVVEDIGPMKLAETGLVDTDRAFKSGLDAMIAGFEATMAEAPQQKVP